MTASHYTTIFLDIGGVILTNGWDHKLREKAAEVFGIDFVEMNKRHGITFDTYEIGKISLNEYLDRIVFYTERNFSRQDFKEFMFNACQSYPQMLNLILQIKRRLPVRVIAVTNEGRELMEDRIRRFNLKEVVDFFVCSGFVGLRKPDFDIYRLALDLSQAKPQEVVYIDDRPILTEIGRKFGLQVIQHSTYEQTQQLLNEFFPQEEHRQCWNIFKNY